MIERNSNAFFINSQKVCSTFKSSSKYRWNDYRI